MNYQGVVCKCPENSCDCQAHIVRKFMEDEGQYIRGHAFLSPSSFKLMMNCPASMQRRHIMKLRKDFLKDNLLYKASKLDDEGHKLSRLQVMLAPDEPEADDGSIFHAVFETCMLTQTSDEEEITAWLSEPSMLLDLDIGKNRSKNEIDFLRRAKLSDNAVNDEELIDIFINIVQKYVELLNGADWYACEVKVKIPGTSTFGTVDLVFKKDGVYHVYDLKTGRLEVHAEENDQMCAYAFSIIDLLNIRDTAAVELGVIGIRFSSDVWKTTAGWVIEYGERMWDKANDALSPNPSAHAGDHCMNCEAKMFCKEFMDYSFRVISNLDKMCTFDNAGEEFAELSTPDLVTNFLAMKAVEKMTKDLKAELEMRFEGFAEDPDNRVKYVEGSMTKKIGDEAVAVARIKEVLQKNAAKGLEVKPKSIAQLKKVLPQEVMDEIIVEVPKRGYVRIN